MLTGLKTRLRHLPNLVYPFVFAAVFAIAGVSYLLLSRAATVESADLNRDGVVNVYDLGMFLGKFGTNDQPADINGDGVVNIYDLGIFLGYFGQTVKPSTISGLSPGINSGGSHPYSLNGFKAIGGVKYARMEWDVKTSADSMRQDISDYADAGIEIVPLAGFSSYIPTDAEAENLANWAAMYGPDGSFWISREQTRQAAGLSDDSNLAVRLIEFGNETNMTWQYGDNWDSPSYLQRAKDYATRFKAAQIAIQTANSKVGLLAQGDDGGTGSANWVDGMYAAVPDLTSANRVAGWTIHPYGPFSSGDARIKRMLQQQSVHGAPTTIPIDITEYGIASKNGVALTDNYGWPVNLTYAQAANDLETTLNSFVGSPTYGSRVRLFMIYGIMDLNFSTPATDNDREHFFGAVDVNFHDKGAYTNEVRNIMKR
jgi:hypothetical protein